MLWRPFIQKASRIIDTPWTIAAGSDFAFPGVTGPKPAGTNGVNWYLDRVHRAAATDRVVCRTFFDVANLLAPATALFHPRVVARVVKACLAHVPAPVIPAGLPLHDRPSSDSHLRINFKQL